MNERHRQFGPWTTSLDAGRLELSAFWRRRMAALVALQRAGQRASRRWVIMVAAAGGIVAATPLMHYTPAATGAGQPGAEGLDTPVAPADAVDLFSVRFSNGVELELIGLANYPSAAEPWWRPDGVPLANRPYARIDRLKAKFEGSPLQREICWRWRGADDPEIRTDWQIIENTNGWGNGKLLDADGRAIAGLTAYAIPFSDEQPTCTLRFTMSRPTTEWEVYHEDQAGNVSTYVSHPPGFEVTGVTFDKPRDVAGGAFVVMGYKLGEDQDVRLIAVDREGKRHIGKGEFAGGMMGFRQLAVHFEELHPGAIVTWIVERRTRTAEVAEFRNVSLHAGRLSPVELVLGDRQKASSELELAAKAKPPEKAPGDPEASDAADRILPGEFIVVDLTGGLPRSPHRQYRLVEPGKGEISLGVPYGRVAVAGLSLEDAERRIAEHLQQWLTDADVAVTFPIAGRRRPISENVDKPARIQRGSIYHIEVGGAPSDFPLVGPRRVEASGKVSLGPTYGRVKIDGLTLEEAESTIEEHLKEILTDPQVGVTLGDFPPPEGE